MRTDSRALGLHLFIATSIAGLTAGCLERESGAVAPCTQAQTAQYIQVDSVPNVDLLLVVDNSGSMANNQAQLAMELPRLVRILVTGEDEDGVIQPFDPVRDLHLGVVSTDLGAAGHAGIPSCSDSPELGDDALLQTLGRGVGCADTYPPLFRYRPAEPTQSPEEFAFDVGCVALLGASGCGFEQTLEVTLKALSPSAPTTWTRPDYAPPVFFGGTTGHGDGPNADFIRDDSVLAIVMLTDQDDYSIRDPELVNPDGLAYPGDLNSRHILHPEALHGVDRYVDGLLQLRRSTHQLVVGAITGVPADLLSAEGYGERYDYDTILSDPRMQPGVDDDPDRRGRPLLSCDEPGIGEADPPNRIVETLRRLDDAGVGVALQSICQNSFAGALDVIVGRIADALRQACLPRALNPRGDGSVDCDVVAIAPEGRECDEVPGSLAQRHPDGSEVRIEGRAACVVEQLIPSAAERADGAPPDGVGWYYDDYTRQNEDNCPDRQRIAFTTGAQVPIGTLVQLRCLQGVTPSHGEVAVGTFCEGDLSCADGLSPEGSPLTCDPVQRTCGVACRSDADCRTAGLVGFVCDARTLGEADPQSFPDDDTPYAYCVNPTCG